MMSPLEPRIDDLTFDDLVAEAKARIPVHNPEWTNHSAADPGVTVLELFAFMTESLLYRANRIPDRSRRKFLQLVGLRPNPASAARGLVTFDSTKGPVSRVIVEAGTEVRAGAIPFQTCQAIDVLPVTAIVCAKTEHPDDPDEVERRAQFLAMYDDYADDAEDVRFYETTRLEVPSGATTYRPIELADTIDQSIWVALLAPDEDTVHDVRDELAGRTLTLGVFPGVEDADKVIYPGGAFRKLEQTRVTVSIPVPETFEIGEPKAPRYRDLTTTERGDVEVEPGTITIEMPADAGDLGLWDLDALEAGFGDFPPLLDDPETDRVVTWLRLRRRRITAAGAPADDTASRLGLSLAWLGVNAAPVVQCRSVRADRVGRGDGTPDQTFRLAQTPVIPESVTVRVGDDAWERTDDLAAAPSEVSVGGLSSTRQLTGVAGSPNAFAVDADGVLHFGSGLRGTRPPVGADIIATYDYGGGKGGLVGVGAISTGIGLPQGVKVANAVPTWGGSDAEALTDAESRMSQQIRHRDRLVTVADATDLTMQTPGVDIGRVDVLPLVHPEVIGVEAPGVITIMVVPRHDPLQPNAPRPDRMFLDAVCRHLEPRRLVTTELHIQGPVYRDISVSVGFDVVAGRDLPPVREAITRRLRDFASPLPNDTFEGWDLQKAIDPREFLAEVARVPGVRRVNGVLATIEGVDIDAPYALQGLELPRIFGLSVQPGDPSPIADLTGSFGPDPKLLPVPVIPEDC